MCDFSPLSAKDKSASQTPAECVKVFNNLTNVQKKEKKHRSLNAFNISVCKCFLLSRAGLCQYLVTFTISNMLFRCLHHIDLWGWWTDPTTSTPPYIRRLKKTPAAWSPSTHSRDRIPGGSAGMWRVSSGRRSLVYGYVKGICQGALTNDVLMNCDSQCTKTR